MISLCFGSYASLFKNAINKPNADKAVVPLLFSAIDKCACDDADCNKWLKAQKKLPSTIASPVNPIDPRAVEIYFTDFILPRITDENKRQTFHQYLYSLVVADTNIEEQEKSDLTAALIVKNYSFFNSRIFLYAITQSNTKGVNLEDIELLPLPKAPSLTSSIYDTGFDRVFASVSHCETLNLCNRNFIKLFRLDVSNCTFAFDNLNDFLEKNLGRYVYSRAMRDQLINDGHLENIGKKAVELLKKAGGFDKTKISEELGDIILYILLEKNLIAPKIYNKIEFAGNTDTPAVNQGGVHLLTLDSTGAAFQIVIAKSKIIGDLRTAIDNAFSVIATANKNISSEYKLLDSSILNQSFTPQVADYLRSIIIPTKRKAGLVVHNAFGVFLGYSIGIDRSKYSNDEFVKVVETKMAEDIKNQISYIGEKIATNNLGGYSFYFYLIPFNDADCEKISIMQNLVGGGE